MSSANAFFEVSTEQIHALEDGQLRELVARIAKAKLSSKGHSPELVSWGGDQSAPDGGIDVRADMPIPVAESAGFPAALIGYQVKATRMPESEIRSEMCPGGVLRPSIREIIQACGAYVIVSNESLADGALQTRVRAVREAATGVSATENAKFDFYDARRVADMVNAHPGLVAWVRNAVGAPLSGWRPFGPWANSRGSKKLPFIEDDSKRFVDPASPDRKGSLGDGIDTIRGLLSHAGTSIRIAGLSGVGKTRFVQALFEESSRHNALAPDLAIYTDLSESQTPTPGALVDELQANHRRAIVIVDNCSQEAHRQLTTRIRNSKSISLITIEYDIREDLPEETHVFRLEKGSDALGIL